MNVVMLSPGYPAEMAYFTRALAAVGRPGHRGRRPAAARAARAPPARRSRTTSTSILADEGAVLDALRGLARHASIDQVECLWEPYMLLAARIREAFGLPGLTVEQTVPFRDKETMKRVLDAAGHPHARGTSARAPSPRSGRPPRRSATRSSSSRSPAPARPTPTGSTPTRSSPTVLPLLRHVPEVSVEEFVDGEEFTFDTICAGGQILFEHVLWYRPRPLQMRMHEWVSPVSISLRDLSVPAPGRRTAMGAGGAGRARLPRPASRTWSGTSRPTARPCSARSAPARPAPASST